jgi:fido (protein-threonine AMPylation protein)
MGKLTLNILLSFAQFEREVSAERIRDKIAATKKKGMWTGGSVPLGYDVENKKLIVNHEEAKIVRYIFEEYLREKEPEKKEKSYAWHTAIGLQAVDGINTSEYLIETAKKQIDGDITFEEANDLIHSYYKENIARNGADRTEEADKVSVRIAQLLSEKSFVFSPAQYISIHSQLFKGIYKHAGKIRDYNITKNEWVLEGDTVMYGGALDLKATLDYDFSIEKEFSYKNLSMEEIIKHLAVFVSRLWQIHIFSEGNTRATAVFFIKYLRTLGFDVTNDIFADNAWYFRNALVRANYTNLKKGVHETTEYLELFLRNLLLAENNPLRNRDMHISGSLSLPKCQTERENVTLDVTLDEMQVLNMLKADGKLTQKRIGELIGKSERTIKRITASLEKKKFIERVNGKRFGYWKVNVE